MCTSKVDFWPVLMALTISGASIWSQVVQAADTIPVTMTGIIQAPTVSETGPKVGAITGENRQAADTIPVTITGIIQAPAVSKTDERTGVVIGGTRMIYDGNQKESTITVRNQGKGQWRIQSWVDNDGIQGKNSEKSKPPFEVMPVLFRLGPDGNCLLHVRQTSGHLPTDRESVYWLNIKTIPDDTKKQTKALTMSVNQRLKLFYRPAGLKTPTEDDYSQLTFRKDGENLRVSNPTPYYVTFYSLNVGGEDIQTNGRMVPPKGAVSYKLAFGAIINGRRVDWQIIDDFGMKSKLTNSALP